MWPLPMGLQVVEERAGKRAGQELRLVRKYGLIPSYGILGSSGMKRVFMGFCKCAQGRSGWPLPMGLQEVEERAGKRAGQGLRLVRKCGLIRSYGMKRVIIGFCNLSVIPFINLPRGNKSIVKALNCVEKTKNLGQNFIW